MDGQDAEPLPVRPLVEWSDVQCTSAWLGQLVDCLYKWVSAESAGWTFQRKRRGRNTSFGSTQLLRIAKHKVSTVMYPISSCFKNESLPFRCLVSVPTFNWKSKGQDVFKCQKWQFKSLTWYAMTMRGLWNNTNGKNKAQKIFPF